MISCAPPFRRIASNLLWTGSGFERDPLVVVSAEGALLGVERCADPDRRPFTEFCPGVVVCGFPREFRAAFDRLIACRQRPLADLLRELRLPAPDAAAASGTGCTVVLSGLDYAAMRLTGQSRIRRL